MKNHLSIKENKLFVKVVSMAIMSIVIMGFETLTARVNPSKTDGLRWCSYQMSLSDPAGYNILRLTEPSPGNSTCLPWSDEPKCTATPTVTTKPATDITAVCATLKGIVNPNLGTTNYYFDWGTTTAYGYTTALKSAGGGSSNVNVFAYISGLTPGTTYHFKLVATNALGTTNGNDMSFVAGSVGLTTLSITGITSVTAVSGGNITSNGGSNVTARGVCWSISVNPVISDAHTTDGSGNGSFTSTITGLTAGTIYHVRAYATNTTGTFYGNDIEFSTLHCGNYALPYNEGFSAGVMPDCWSQSDHQGNGQIWQFGTIIDQSPNPMLNGNYAFLNSNAYGNGDSQNADLISPVFDFSGYETINLQFNHFMLNTAASSGSLSFSTDNGSSWVPVQVFSSTSAANPEVFNQAIDAVAGQTMVIFKWNYTGTFGSYWAIDDIQIAGILSPPTLSVTPSNREVTPQAGTITFSVESNVDWTAASDQTWCIVTPSGTGNGTITATYTVNNSASQRVASITVTGAGLSPVVVTVTQIAPLISVSPDNQEVGYLAGNVLFTVTSNSNWTASDNQTWCTVTYSGSGNGNINAEFEENTLFTPRIAEITIMVNGLSPVIVTVTQAASPALLSVTPANQNVSPAAGSVIFDVSTPSTWMAGSDQLWCVVTPSGEGNGTITATYELNTTNSERVANVTVTATGLSPVIVTVTQGGLPSSGFITTIQNVVQTSPTQIEFELYLLDTDPSQQFILAGYQAGIYINPGIFPAGATINVGILNNTLYSDLLPGQRPTAIQFETATNTIKLAGQVPPGPGIPIDEFTYQPNGTIISTAGIGSRVCRIRVTSSMDFTPNSLSNLMFKPSNVVVPDYATRVAQYVDTNMEIVWDEVNEVWSWFPPLGTPPENVQHAVIPGINAIVNGNPLLNGPPVLEVAPGSVTVDIIAGDYGFTINSNTTWIAHTDQPWVTITPSGFGNETMIATYAVNTSEPRSSIITVSVPGLEDTEVTLSQEGFSMRTLNLNLLIEGLYAGNGTMNQAHDANGPHFEAGVSDLITVELHNSADYAIVELSVTDVELSTAGNATINLPPTLNGSYYITFKHRNSIETTSANPVWFGTPVVNYAFDASGKAYGNSLLLMDGHYLVKSGDINQDGSVDTGDMTLIDNESAGFATGYIPADVNGDGMVDTADMTIVDNNSMSFAAAETP